MTKRAFTLIEVMVVLTILALIAILAYNFFGNTMKEARLKQQVTEVHRLLSVYGDARELHFLQSGTYSDNIDDYVTSGTLKSRQKTFIGDQNYDPQILLLPVSLAGSSDLVVGIDTNVTAASDELCKAYNAEYTDLGSIIPVMSTDDGTGYSTICMLDEGNVFLIPIEYR